MAKIFSILGTVLGIRFVNALLDFFEIDPMPWVVSHFWGAPTEAKLDLARWGIAALIGAIIWGVVYLWERRARAHLANSEWSAQRTLEYLVGQSTWGRFQLARLNYLQAVQHQATVEFRRAAREGEIQVRGRLPNTLQSTEIDRNYWMFSRLRGDQPNITEVLPGSSVHPAPESYSDLRIRRVELEAVWPTASLLTRMVMAAYLWIKLKWIFRPFRGIWSKVEPSHIIVLGLLIAAIGVGWQFYRGRFQPSAAAPAAQKPSPDVAADIKPPLQTEIDGLKKELAERSQPKASTTRLGKIEVEANKPESKRYTAYEKEQRLRAVDEIYNAIATQLQPAYSEGRKVVYGVYKAADANSEQHLTEYAVKVEAAFDSLNALLEKYKYFTDIVQAATKNTFNNVAATHGVKNLVRELQQLRAKVPSDIQWFLLRNTTMSDAINQINAFERYLNETLPLLRTKRTEIEASDFSIPVMAPTEAPGKKSDLEWNLEGNSENVNFLGLSMASSGLLAHHFQTRGWNKTLDPIRSPRAYIRAENTAVEYEGLFNPGNGKLVPASQVEVIPVGAMLDITVPFTPDRKPIPLNKFLAEFVPFTFIFESPDVSFRQTVSKEQVAHRIRVYQEAVNEKLMTRPMIQIRSNSNES